MVVIITEDGEPRELRLDTFVQREAAMRQRRQGGDDADALDGVIESTAEELCVRHIAFLELSEVIVWACVFSSMHTALFS